MGVVSRLLQAKLNQYQRDGFVCLPNLFEVDELKALSDACLNDPTLGGALMAFADSAGNAQDVALYTELSDDLVGVIPRMNRMVEMAEFLLKKPCYHWHSKLSMKRPGSMGTWDWHQDYGYWYHQGVLAPDMITAAIAVDQNTISNGSIRVLRGSHNLGRVDHTRIGEASGADEKRLEEALRRFEEVVWELDVGDVMFFHCNLLHCSGSNNSTRPRTTMHCSYNAIDNVPFIVGQEAHADVNLKRVADNAILNSEWDTIFDNQIFINNDGDLGYGYKVLRAGQRAKGQRTNMEVSGSL